MKQKDFIKNTSKIILGEKKMKILITGGCGHIGSKLMHAISSGQFEEVRIIDNLLTQRYPSLFNLPQEVKFMFYEDDICTADLDALMTLSRERRVNQCLL